MILDILDHEEAVGNADSGMRIDVTLDRRTIDVSLQKYITSVLLQNYLDIFLILKHHPMVAGYTCNDEIKYWVG